MAFVPHEPSEARLSRVVLLLILTSTLPRPSSSVAEPVKVSGLPGATVSVDAPVGGTITAGWLIDTDGAMPDSLTIHSPSAVSRSGCPAVSVALAWAFQVPSLGTVISLDQVVLL